MTHPPAPDLPLPSAMPPAAAPHDNRLRSGTVARLSGVPVATLRVWERRYAVTRPALSPSGQRLYSAADVQRLALLKRLTDMGHAIGGLALLSMAQLQAVAATHAGALPGPNSPQLPGSPHAPHPPHPPRSPADALPLPMPARRTCHVVVVGAALSARLQQPALLRAWHPAVRLSGPFVDVAQANAAVGRDPVDLLLVHEPRPHEGWLADCQQAAPTFVATPKALLYRFATESVVTALVQAGVRVLREPQPDAVVGQWLRGLTPPFTAAPDETAPHSTPPRRWDDAVLSDIAGLSSTVACECPRHVAELLMQLSHFEAYSADCVQRSPADAALHQHLLQVAAASRALFESALERVAQHEGLLLPDSLQT